MNLLVTGGAGFIGSHFVRAVLADRLPGLEGAFVTVLDKITYAGNFANLGAVAESKRLDFVPADVRDAPVVDATLRNHDAVVHFAAATRSPGSPGSPSHPGSPGDELATANVAGTQVLLDAALRHGVSRFVQISTAAVYGSIDTGAWTERSSLAPTTPYAASKAGADLMALAYHHSHGLPVVVARCSATYGTHQHPEKLVPRLVTAVLDARPVPLPGDGSRIRDWLHVEDHCHGVALALLDGRPGEVYHVGGSVELSHRDLTALILDESGAGWERVAPQEDPKTGDHRRALDDDKIRRELGWRPRVEFAAGVAATIRWYRENPTWWRPLLPG